MVRRNTPERGDIVFMDFDPQSGHEQAGRRPAIVLSPSQFNAVTGFASVCPITSTKRGWGFEIELPSGLPVQGVILADQLKNLDWRTRGATVKGQAPQDVIDDVLHAVRSYL